jgi:hypothetical protein
MKASKFSEARKAFILKRGADGVASSNHSVTIAVDCITSCACLYLGGVSLWIRPGVKCRAGSQC